MCCGRPPGMLGACSLCSRTARSSRAPGAACARTNSLWHTVLVNGLSYTASQRRTYCWGALRGSECDSGTTELPDMMVVLRGRLARDWDVAREHFPVARGARCVQETRWIAVSPSAPEAQGCTSLTSCYRCLLGFRNGCEDREVGWPRGRVD